MNPVRQQEIVKIFYKVAKKEGLENASVAKTAAAMDINPSLILHYFQSREQLVFQLVEYIMDKYLLIFRVHSKNSDDAKAILLMTIDNIFSKKWNRLFDDGVSYSCYSLVFRDKKIKRKYKTVLDKLRSTLETLILNCKDEGTLKVEDPAYIADLIFILVDGAYYYLSLVDNREEYQSKLDVYKLRAIKLLNLSS